MQLRMQAWSCTLSEGTFVSILLTLLGFTDSRAQAPAQTGAAGHRTHGLSVAKAQKLGSCL